jgi:LAS superfamily LD-carboxypeptidase LdcB
VTAALVAASLAGCASAGANAVAGSSVSVSNSDELGPDDGYILPGQTVKLSDDVASVTKLTPTLRDALVRANDAAEADRAIEITLVDGWRSERYQQYLFGQAVVKYGSEQEASRWVKRGNQSQHQLGKAVDVATADAMDWLSRFGAKYGLCQVYANEAWHFELRADASGSCPPQLTDGSAG